MTMLLFLLPALLFSFLALALFGLAWRARQATGLPIGAVLYRDTNDWQPVAEPLISRRYGLVGKPDYLVQVHRLGRKVTIPVEVKSRRRPSALDEGHVIQLAAYCLLVEEHFTQTPPYGLLRYADATVKIPFTSALRRQVLHTAEALRRSQSAPDLARNHADPARCLRCGYHHGCGAQALTNP